LAEASLALEVIPPHEGGPSRLGDQT